MTLVNNTENNIRNSSTEHPTKSSNRKTKTAKIEEQYFIPSKYINEEIIAESGKYIWSKKIRILQLKI